ncbi:MAG: tRNA lysidine(34) synthetase TilS [Nevskiales bacterium]|nr:tRNA lysidine(34) synthetase TilS [Nevskiales bacterium]
MTDLAPGSAPASPKLSPGATVWVAFSGGLDSTVLLHWLKQSGFTSKALHVNHHLQPAAGGWVEHCRSVCAQLGVPFYAMDVKVDPADPAGPEAAARQARHEAFRSLMKAGDCLVTAHHRDDQAETVLLRLLRGSGVAGLAAMRTLSAFPPGCLWRPLLHLSRTDLRHYAERHGLPWVEDPHNLDPRYSRSFLRTDILPRLGQRWPQSVEQLARTADHCADAIELLDELAGRDLAEAGQGEGLSVRALLRLSRARRNNLLRAWAARAGFEGPSFDALTRLEKEMLRARPDAAPCLAWGDTELRRFRDTLFLMRRLPPPPRGVQLEWDGRNDLKLPSGCGVLHVLKPARMELPLRVIFPRGGERLKPEGSRYTRTLRNLFQEQAIPPWVRERLPLIQSEAEWGAVADRWWTRSFKLSCRRAGLRFVWEHTLAGYPPP